MKFFPYGMWGHTSMNYMFKCLDQILDAFGQPNYLILFHCTKCKNVNHVYVVTLTSSTTL